MIVYVPAEGSMLAATYLVGGVSSMTGGRRETMQSPSIEIQTDLKELHSSSIELELAVSYDERNDIGIALLPHVGN